jgi:hypothetical protein
VSSVGRTASFPECDSLGLALGAPIEVELDDIDATRITRGAVEVAVLELLD